AERRELELLDDRVEEVLRQPPVPGAGRVVEAVHPWADLGHQPVHAGLHGCELIEGQVALPVVDDMAVRFGHVSESASHRLHRMDTYRLLLVSGSLRTGSVNTAVVTTAAALAPPGVMTEVYLGLGTLPWFNPDDDRLPLHP